MPSIGALASASSSAGSACRQPRCGAHPEREERRRVGRHGLPPAIHCPEFAERRRAVRQGRRRLPPQGRAGRRRRVPGSMAAARRRRRGLRARGSAGRPSSSQPSSRARYAPLDVRIESVFAPKPLARGVGRARLQEGGRAVGECGDPAGGRRVPAGGSAPALVRRPNIASTRATNAASGCIASLPATPDFNRRWRRRSRPPLLRCGGPGSPSPPRAAYRGRRSGRRRGRHEWR